MDNTERAITQLYEWANEPGNDMHDEVDLLVTDYRRAVRKLSEAVQLAEFWEHCYNAERNLAEIRAKLIEQLENS
ncbi:MAG TPA: hypothetical protein VN039_00105 [Nitrospira sp.]|nr:hypothetical protein [Nitrospira sp.]